MLLGIGTRVPAFSDQAPQWANILHSTDDDAETAHWFYTGFPVPPAVAAAADFEDDFGRPLPWAPGEAGTRAPAPTAGPRRRPEGSRVSSKSGVGEGRSHVRARIRSIRGAPVLQLAVSRDAGLSAVRLGGRDVPEDRSGFDLFDPEFEVFTIWTVPDSGVVAELEWRSSASLALWLSDRSSGVPAVAHSLIDARPTNAVPIGGGDATLVYTRRSIP